MFPCMKMYIVFLNFLCFSPFYSLKEKQKIKSYDIKNCYLLSPIMKIEIMKPTQSKSKSSLVLPNTINQSFYVTMYYNVLKKRIGIKNWDQFSAQLLSPYIKQSNIAFFDEKKEDYRYFPKSSIDAPAGIWTRDLSHLSPTLFQKSYQGMVV